MVQVLQYFIMERKKERKKLKMNDNVLPRIQHGKINFLFSFVVGQHGHLSSGLHPAHAHMHGGWYPSGMGALGASSGLQGGFSSGSLSGGVVPHSQSYHLGISTMVSLC